MGRLVCGDQAEAATMSSGWSVEKIEVACEAYVNAYHEMFGDVERWGDYNPQRAEVMRACIRAVLATQPDAILVEALQKISTEDDGLPTYTPQAMVEIAKRALATLQATQPFRYCDGCSGHDCDPQRGCSYPDRALSKGALTR
jgi:hypothetical protein